MILNAIGDWPEFRDWLQNLKNVGERGRVFAYTNEPTRNPPEAVDKKPDGFHLQNIVSRAVFSIFSNPEIQCSHMSITPTSNFSYNNTFPSMFGGTWRITAPGGGFTGTFTVPTDGQYDLVVTHGSSYNDLLHRPGYSPVTIQVNSKTVVQGYDPAAHHPGVHDMPTDRWLIFAHAGQNTLQWTYDAHGTTHYWIHGIVIQSEQ